MAFGVGDFTIRVWNLSNFTSIEIVSLWQKIKGKVMAVSIISVNLYLHAKRTLGYASKP
jgi:hypothetical protein